jgi:hypothetical protein
VKSVIDRKLNGVQFPGIDFEAGSSNSQVAMYHVQQSLVPLLALGTGRAHTTTTYLLLVPGTCTGTSTRSLYS